MSTTNTYAPQRPRGGRTDETGGGGVEPVPDPNPVGIVHITDLDAQGVGKGVWDATIQEGRRYYIISHKPVEAQVWVFTDQPHGEPIEFTRYGERWIGQFTSSREGSLFYRVVSETDGLNLILTLHRPLE